ncbi:hypothetical protein [Spiroplasma endosymbiont of Polydrusus formosus]|uniref:hypothetical protein n=1 Tax=Spiroplasma endosymbiont of Polydrusus formosus TaxID=3139326 RepID=UPI0035B507BE
MTLFCLLIDLFNREIIGYSVARDKQNSTTSAKKPSIQLHKRPLKQITLFHTDWGNEFKNKIIDNTLNIFNTKQPLSNKSCPYDNVMSETTYKSFKT